MKAPRFAYVRAKSVAEVLALLEQHGAEARILAGGQSLMPTLNMRLSRPSLLIDINRLESLQGIAVEDGAVRIGALARHVEVMRSPLVAEHLPLIAEAMPHVAHLAVRNRGTFGGSIALADPAAELPACALTLEAIMVVESVRGRRFIAASEYFLGLFETARRADELLIEVRVPCRQPGTVNVFMELARRQGDFAMAGICVVARFEGERIAALCLVYFGSEDKPTLAKHAIAAINGKPYSPAMVEAACAALADDLRPMSGLETDPSMLLHLQRVLTRRALAEAAIRATKRAMK